MAGTRCHGWERRFARLDNLWLLRVAMTPMSGSEFRVLLYYVARTWGDFDARRGEAGRPWVRVSSREIAAEIGMTDYNVRRATARLVKHRLLRRFRPHRGRLPAAVGPETMSLRLAAESRASVEQTPEQPLEALLDALSPQLRSAVEASRERWEA